MKLSIENLLIGQRAQADHPITCLNPDPYFEIHEVKFEGGRLWVRGETTMWFGQSLVSVFPEYPELMEGEK